MSSFQLLIDLHVLQDRRLAGTGAARHTAELGRALLAAGAPIAGLALDPALPWPDDLHPDLAGAPQLCWNTARTFRRLRDEGPVGYHVAAALDGRRPLQGPLPSYVMGHGVPLVATVHGSVTDDAAGAPAQQALRRADLVLTSSPSSRGQVIRHLGVSAERVVDVGVGVSSFWRPAGDDVYTLLSDHVPEITGPFVVTTARHDAVVDVVAGLRGPNGVAGLRGPNGVAGLRGPNGVAGLSVDVQLLVVGPIDAEEAARWRARATAQGMAAHRLVIGGVLPDAVLRAAFLRASAFVAPTDGWAGMAALEAGACGCPAVLTAMGDGGGPAPVVERILSDGAYRDELRDRGMASAREHSWDGVAGRVVDAYGRLQPPSRPLRRRRIAVALVGPMAPTRSGVAAYTTRLAVHLADRCELDCITDDAGHGDSTVPTGEGADRGYRRFPYHALGRVLEPTAYDAIVYALGSDPSCRPAHDLATRYPGLAWLHDRRMADHEVTARSRGAIVASHIAGRLLDLDAGPLAPPVDTWVVPLAVPPAPEPSMAAGSPDPERPELIVVLGSVTAVKQPEVVLTAVGLANQSRPVRLAFVGDVDPTFRAALLGRAQALGIGERVELTGYLDDGCYRAWASRATMAVQLDTRTTGAGSAALTDCLAAGLATVTSVGAAVELPAATVTLVPADVTPEELNRDLVRHLSVPAHREAMAARARAYAGAWTFDDVAESLLDVIRRSARAREQ